MSSQVQQHFVNFYSPGTLFSEVTQKPIDSWSVDAAKEMAKLIMERYGAKPYGFRFCTRGRREEDLDSSVTAESGMYYLGGTIYTIDDVRNGLYVGGPTLLMNMESNGWNRIIVNSNSWTICQPLMDGDVVLDMGS